MVAPLTIPEGTIHELFKAVPESLALLEYGGGAAGVRNARSDADLILITSKQLEPHRVHTGQVDMNLLELASLHSLLDRLVHNEERPWDGMFRNVRILAFANVSEPIRELVCDIELAYRAPASRHLERNGLRFLASRAIGDCEPGVEEPLRSLTISSAVGVLLFSWSLLSGLRWSGYRDALRDCREKCPELHNLLAKAASEGSIVAIQRAEAVVFREFGGPWGGELLTLAGGFVTAEGEKLSAVQEDAIGKFLRDVEVALARVPESQS